MTLGQYFFTGLGIVLGAAAVALVIAILAAYPAHVAGRFDPKTWTDYQYDFEYGKIRYRTKEQLLLDVSMTIYICLILFVSLSALGYAGLTLWNLL